MGSHVVDLLEMFFSRTKKITARTFNRVHQYPVEDGLWSHLVMEAAYKSARTGKTIAPRMKP
jgi:hypothetical protein